MKKNDFLDGWIAQNLEILPFRSVHELLICARIKSLLLTFITSRGLAYCQKCHAHPNILCLMCILNATSKKCQKINVFVNRCVINHRFTIHICFKQFVLGLSLFCLKHITLLWKTIRSYYSILDTMEMLWSLSFRCNFSVGRTIIRI